MVIVVKMVTHAPMIPSSRVADTMPLINTDLPILSLSQLNWVHVLSFSSIWTISLNCPALFSTNYHLYGKYANFNIAWYISTSDSGVVGGIGAAATV